MGRLLHVIALCAFGAAAPAWAAEWFVAPGAAGVGTEGSPFGTIQEGLNAAQPGDVVTVAAGTYAESLVTVRPGEPGAPIVLRAAQGATPLVSRPANLLRVSHPHFQVERLTFDAQYAAVDAIVVDDPADFFTLRATEVRRTSRDCIDIRSPSNVLIEASLIHHCLNPTGGRSDAHGIVAGAVRDLTVRNTKIHTFSGDGLRVDPGRHPLRWDRVTLEGCHVWLAPLPAAENGFAAGVVPGENAISTAILAGGGGGNLTVRDSEVWGFREGLVGERAALELTEEVQVTLDGVTVRDSEIALRLAYPAQVTIRNAVVHHVGTAVRYEGGLVSPKLLNSTFGQSIEQAFVEVSSPGTVFDARNLLFLAASLPPQASDDSNLAVPASAFLNAAADDYRLAEGSLAIDTGASLAEVTTDRRGFSRPRGAGHDRGAYEWAPPGCDVPDPTPLECRNRRRFVVGCDCGSASVGPLGWLGLMLMARRAGGPRARSRRRRPQR